MTTVLKLGGSLITDKTGELAVDHDTLTAVCQDIADRSIDELLIVHGGGSFGHPVAATYGASSSEPIVASEGIVSISRAMESLNKAVIDALHAVNAPAIPVSARGFAVKQADGSLSVSSEAIAMAIAEGFIPVTYGEIIPQAKGGYAIVSGDELAIALASALDADAIGLCSDVPGVLDDTDAVIPHITSLEAIEAYLDSPDGVDVTGGIEAKVDHLLSVPIPSAIFGRESLAAFLSGTLPGTRIGRAGNADSF